ncbi:MAG TPA: hypothetical protein VLL50_12490 [Usitatibacter sp.]|nr:hypothetical protein [Usitatibacter sp.]
MANAIAAQMHGGAFDGQTIALSEPLQTVRLEDFSSGRLAIHGYLFDRVDAQGVRHYRSDHEHPMRT